MGKSKYAKKTLAEVPEDSVVLFPESVSLSGMAVKKYSRDKELFIIYNSDTKENGKRYISMHAPECLFDTCDLQHSMYFFRHFFCLLTITVLSGHICLGWLYFLFSVAEMFIKAILYQLNEKRFLLSGI